MQVAAEELDLPLASVALVTVDTAGTRDEGPTAGSHSTQDSGTATRNAAANVRVVLLKKAAEQLQVNAEELSTTGDGRILVPDGRKISYGQIAAMLSLHVEAIAGAPLREKTAFRTMGTNLPRLESA